MSCFQRGGLVPIEVKVTITSTSSSKVTRGYYVEVLDYTKTGRD